MSNPSQEKNHDSYARNELYSLFRIFGLGVKNNFSISQNNVNGLMAWVTGPYIVFYDIKTEKMGNLLLLEKEIVKMVKLQYMKLIIIMKKKKNHINFFVLINIINKELKK